MSDNKAGVILIIWVTILILITIGDPDILDGLIKMVNK